MPRSDLTTRHRHRKKCSRVYCSRISEESYKVYCCINQNKSRSSMFLSCAQTYFLIRRFHFASKRGIQQWQSIKCFEHMYIFLTHQYTLIDFSLPLWKPLIMQIIAQKPDFTNTWKAGLTVQDTPKEACALWAPVWSRESSGRNSCHNSQQCSTHVAKQNNPSQVFAIFLLSE